MTSPAAQRPLPGLAGAARWAFVTLPSLVVLVSVPFDLLPWLRGPAPYPPEWQWGYRTDPTRLPAVAVAISLAVLGLVAASFSPALRRRPPQTARWLVLAAVLLGWALPLALLAREPAGALRTLLARTLSRSITSYLTVAVSEDARDPLAFLRHHADLLPELAQTAKHAATHPPGAVLYYRAMVGACEWSPALTEAILGMAGTTPRDYPPPLTRPARAGALLGVLLLDLAGALAAWPIARLALALGLERLAAARLALLWAVLPGPALMTPRVDQALALLVSVFAVLLLGALRPRSAWARVGRAALAGATGGIALFISYGSVVFLATTSLAALAAAAAAPSVTDTPGGTKPRAAGWRAAATLSLVSAAVAIALGFGLPALLGHEPLRAMCRALAIHREAYTAPRSYWLWLVFNPLDLALFLGPPVAALALWRAVSGLRRALSGAALEPAARFGLVTVAAVLTLVLLGVTRGEVGRIWIPLMPALLVGAVGQGDARDSRGMLAIATLVAALTLALGARWNV
jgi:hypothetical protein